jgi:hypothetical protein
MNDFARMGKQVARGLPYLKKDLARKGHWTASKPCWKKRPGLAPG